MRYLVKFLNVKRSFKISYSRNCINFARSKKYILIDFFNYKKLDVNN